jgi:IS605 OrfB family transposase
MFLTYKYRLKDKRAKRLLLEQSRAVNTVWNYCVETQRKNLKINKEGGPRRKLSHFDLSYLTGGTSKELKLHSQSIGDVCKQFVTSRDQGVRCPKFRKSFGPSKSLGWIPFRGKSRQLEDNSVKYVGKVIRFFGSKRRPLPDVVKGGCFVEDASGKWYVCLWVEVSPLPPGTGEIGIDLGLNTLATTSNGYKIENPRSYRQLETKLATAQRAGKKKRTRNIHAKIKNVRKDFLHKATAKLAVDNKLIVVGNVNSTKLAKTNMAKSVYDAGWGMFRDMLRYKASRHGAEYRVVNEAFTTQTCSQCGNRATPGRPKGIAGLGISEWVCSECGASHDRDVNAALNILALGRSVAPRVDGS